MNMMNRKAKSNRQDKSTVNRISRTGYVVFSFIAALFTSLPAFAGTPTFSVAFSPSTIAPGATSTLTYTIDNTANTIGVSDVAFTNTLPAGMTIQNPSNASTTCIDGIFSATAGGSSITFSGYRIGKGTSCTLTVDVTSSTVGANSNTTGSLTSSGGTTGTANATLTVDGARPGFSMAFSPTTINPGGISTLTYTIDNSLNGSNANGLSFAHYLPSGMTISSDPVSSTTCNAPGFAPSPLGTQVQFSGSYPTVNAGATCTTQVNVTASNVGVYATETGELTALGVSSGKASAQLTVESQFLNMTFPNSASPGQSVTLTYTMTNTDRNNDATGISFTNDLNATLSGLAATSLPSTGFCGSGSTISGTSNLTVSNASLASGSSCTFNVTVLVPSNAAAGSYTNTTSTINLTLGTATTKTASSNTLVVKKAPSLTMAFVDDPVGAGENVTLRYTITNTDTTNSATAVGLTTVINETLGNVTMNAPPAANSCGSGSTFTSATDSSSITTITVAGGTLAAGASCTFDFILAVGSGASPGSYVMTSSQVSATVSGSTLYGNSASDTLVVVAPPLLQFGITEDSAIPGATVTAQFTLEYNANASADVTGVGFTLDLNSALSGLTSTTATQTDICGSGSSLSGTSTLTFSGGSLTAGTTCTFSVTLQVPSSAAAGTITATTSSITGTTSSKSVTGAAVSDTLVISGLSLTHQYLTNPTLPGSSTTLRYTITNAASAQAATAIQFTHNLSTVISGITVSGSLPSAPCGTSSVVSGTTNMSISGAELTPGASCNIDIPISIPSGATDGVYNSITSNMSATVNSVNTTTSASSTSLTIETLTVLLSTTAESPTTTSPIPVKIDFSRDVTNFVVSDLVVSNGSAGNFAGSGKAYTVDITPSTSGTVTVDLPANAVDDAVDGTVKNPAATQLSVTYSSTPATPTPTLVIGSPSLSSTNSGPVTFSVTYTNAEEVNLTTSHITINKTGTATATAAVTNGTTSSATVTLSSISGDGTLGISIGANSARNGTESAAATGPSSTFSVDNTQPTVTLTSSASSVNAPFTANIAFSETVSNFIASDITATNANLSNFADSGNSKDFTVTVTPSSEGAVALNVAANVATDSVSNGNTAATALNVTYDTTSPTLVISGPTAPTNAAFTATFTFNEDVTGFASSDIVATNASISNFNATSAKVYTATITPSAQGSVTLDVAAAKAIDAAGNNNTAATQYSVTYDSVSPTVAISGGSALINAAFTATITFSEDVTGFALADITPSNAQLKNFSASSGTVYKVDVTPTTDGQVTLDIAANSAVDSAGNGNTAATQFSTTYDATKPGITISGPTAPQNAAFTATFTFTEDVTGFAVSDIDAVNANLSNFAATSAKVYTALVTPSADGNVTLNVAVDKAIDTAGNGNTVATQYSVVYDTVGPDLTISGPTTATNSTTFTATFTFAEDVTGFASSDIVATNASLSNFNSTSPSVYTATVTPSAQGAVTLNVATNQAIDTAGNGNAAAKEYSVIFDTVKPTVVISGVNSPTNGPFTATFTFSEDVTGFAVTDITATNGALSNFAATSAKVYTATVTPTSNGSVTLDVAAGVAVDSANNGNDAATQYSLTYDGTSPTVSIVGPTAPSNAAYTLTFTFSEDVTGFAVADISVSNASLTDFAATSASSYSVKVTPTTQGNVTVKLAAGVVQDSAGNGNILSDDHIVIYDSIAPTVIISGPTAPINAAFTATITFSENVTGFAQSDISVSNASLGSFNATSASVYTVLVTPTTQNTITLDIPASAAVDQANNGNTASATFNVLHDSVLPTVAISGPTAIQNSAFTATFTFSEDVTGFAQSDVTASNASLSNFSATSASVYTATVTPTADGTVTLDIAANAAVDSANNGNQAAPQYSVSHDATSPSVTINATAGPVSTSFSATFTFSEDVTDFVSADISATNANVSDFTANSSKEYTATITPLANGTVTLNVAAAVAQDSAGNNNTAATQYSVTYDNTRPGVTISGAEGSINSTFTATFTFSKAVNDFTQSKINVTNAQLSNFNAQSAPVYTALVTPSANGAVTLSVSEAAVSDSAGNTNTASNNFSVTYDTVNPTIQTLSPTNSAVDIAVKPELAVTFNESVVAGSSNNLINIIKVSDNTTVESIAANSSAVSIDGAAVKLTLSNNLAEYTNHYITIAGGAFTDTAGNAFSGISNSSTWQFRIINLPPVTVADNIVTDEDNATKVRVLSNDSGENTSLSPSSVMVKTAPGNGSASVDTATGVITYTPKDDFNGTDSFTYVVYDIIGTGSAETTVKATVNAVNDAPVAVNDLVTTAQNNQQTINVLSNDSDPDGSVVSAGLQVTKQPANGLVEVVGGQVTYTPNNSFVGADSFDYIVVDNGGLSSNIATAYISVTGTNVPPTAASDSSTTNEDTAVNINVLSNDTDSDGTIDSTSVAILSMPSNGQTAIQSDGSITYTPNNNFNGNDSFSYIVKDNSGNYSNTSQVSVSVSAVNDAPEALGDALVLLDTTSTHHVNVLGNDKDNDGTITSIAIISQATNGSAVVDSANLSISYTPSSNFSGSDSFSYQITDNNGAVSATATVSVSQTAANDPPLANADSAQTEEDQFISIDVLVNDIDIDGVLNTSSLTITSNPGNGTATVRKSDGMVFYTPNGNFFGTDSFVYQVADNSGATSQATVTVRVNSVNDTPSAATQSVQVAEDGSTSLTLTAVDGDNDTLSYHIERYPSNGKLTGVVPNLTYTPNANFNGSDSFTFYVNDGTVNSSAATVNITVNPTNDQPTANNQQVQVLEDTSLAIFMQGSDPDNDNLTYVIKNNPANGTLTGSGNSRVYAPNANFNGADSFTFVVNDGTVDSAEATVSITVSATNDAPVATAQNVTVDEDNQVTITLSATDIDSQSLTYSVVSNPQSGTLSGTGSTLVYIPNANFDGSDSFTFKANDGSLDSNSATVSISVNPVNDAPVAQSLNLTSSEDVPLPITLLGSDVENIPLTYTVVNQPGNGTLSGTAPNLVYTPNSNFNGIDSFTFRVNDGVSNSTDADVNININAVNDLPVAVDDIISRTDWQTFSIDVLNNDSDADGDTLTVTGATASSGNVTTDGSQLSYTPVNGFIGSVIIDYSISDNNGGTAAARAVASFTAAGSNGLALISVPADVEVDATGLLTKVDVGVATAVDGQGNQLAVTMLNDSSFFKPGINTVYWQATDEQGNTTLASQQVRVNPQINLMTDQVAIEGFNAAITVHLNGQAPQYPLHIPYVIGGTATADDDHDLVDGVVTIESGTEGHIIVNLFKDQLVELDETIEVRLEDSLNLGRQSVHTLTLSEQNQPPQVAFKVAQGAQHNVTVFKDGGEVEILAQAVHPDNQKQYRYQWSSDNEVLNEQFNGSERFSFSPAELAAGTYELSLTVIDSADDLVFVDRQLTFKVAPSSIALGDEDSDNDGIIDRIEGLGDADGDGIADYLDAINSCQVLQSEKAQTSRYLAEGQSGTCLSLGQTALAQASDAALLDNQHTPGGWYDLVVERLNVNGQSTAIVLPQRRPIGENAVYRLRIDDQQWLDFVEDGDNYLMSAPGDAGYCPPPNDIRWQAGLNAGHWCVQVHLNDGGPNDIDMLSNGSIKVPGGLFLETNRTQPQSADDSVTTRVNIATVIDALSNDTNDNSLQIRSADALLGQVSIVDNKLHYQPPGNYFGSDSITYGVTDGSGGSSSAKVSIDIALNNNPTAVMDTATVTAGQSVLIDVLFNDSDIDGDYLTLTNAQAQNGRVEITEDHRLTYYSNSDFEGSDSIHYTVSDGYGGEATAQVTVTVAKRTEQPQQPPATDSTGNSTGGGALLWLWLMCLGAACTRVSSR